MLPLLVIVRRVSAEQVVHVEAHVGCDEGDFAAVVGLRGVQVLILRWYGGGVQEGGAEGYQAGDAVAVAGMNEFVDG